MRFFHFGKDGGEHSTVWGYWLVEIKRLFSIALLCFENGTREAHHTHAFNCVSWVLSGTLEERFLDGRVRRHYPSWRPIVTRRTDFHQVESFGRTWVFTLRGPWVERWLEGVDGRVTQLRAGRVELGAPPWGNLEMLARSKEPAENARFPKSAVQLVELGWARRTRGGGLEITADGLAVHAHRQRIGLKAEQEALHRATGLTGNA